MGGVVGHRAPMPSRLSRVPLGEQAPSGTGHRLAKGGAATILLGHHQVLPMVPYFDNLRIMETLNAAELLAALGHESRLAIFRLLVQAGPAGINASAIGEQLGMVPATLSFHLAHLSRVGLISGERSSRFIHYSANYPVMDDLIAFLTSNCCQGQNCLPQTQCCDTTEKRRAALTEAPLGTDNHG